MMGDKAPKRAREKELGCQIDDNGVPDSIAASPAPIEHDGFLGLSVSLSPPVDQW